MSPDETILHLNATATVLEAPLLSLLPPKSLIPTRKLPLLKSRSSSPSTASPWVVETFIIPAAFPRNYPHSTKTIDARKAKEERVEAGDKIDVQGTMIRMLETQIEAQDNVINHVDDATEQEQLYGVVNRYTKKMKLNEAGRNKPVGLSLVMCHANGFNKEVSAINTHIDAKLTFSPRRFGNRR
jgi:hypothetical protein